MTPTPKAAWTVKEFMAAVGCSRVQVYRLIQRGDIDSRLMGAKRLIITSPHDYVQNLPKSKAA